MPLEGRTGYEVRLHPKGEFIGRITNIEVARDTSGRLTDVIYQLTGGDWNFVELSVSRSSEITEIRLMRKALWRLDYRNADRHTKEIGYNGMWFARTSNHYANVQVWNSDEVVAEFSMQWIVLRHDPELGRDEPEVHDSEPRIRDDEQAIVIIGGWGDQLEKSGIYEGVALKPDTASLLITKTSEG